MPAPNFLISDLDTEVIIRVENRTTDLTRADIWLRDAMLEIAGNPEYRDEFTSLEELGPTFNLTPGVQEYAFSNIVPVGDYNINTLDILLWVDFPTNNIRKKLLPSHYQDSDRFLQAQSIPAEWYRFADNIGFNPLPNQPYQVQARLYKRIIINDANLPATAIQIPREWNEILIWAAAERGFAELLEFEKQQKVHILLHGDPKHPELPGMIEGVKKRRSREAWRDSIPLRPLVRGYGYGKS